jgi:hypothetical protein
MPFRPTSAQRRSQQNFYPSPLLAPEKFSSTTISDALENQPAPQFIGKMNLDVKTLFKQNEQ